MIKKLDSKIRKINHIIGIDVNIPKPTKSSLKLSRGFSSIIGTSCLTVGIICSSTVLLALGTLGTISTIITTREIKKF